MGPPAASIQSPAPTAQFATDIVRGHVRWRLRDGWQHLLLGAQGLRLDEWLEAGQANVVKHGHGRVIYRVDLPEGSIYLKHLRCRSLRRAALQRLRPSACHREFHKALELARRQISTVAPIALGEESRGALPGDSFLITAAIDGSCTLADYTAGPLRQLPAGQQARVARRLVIALAQLVARLHDAGVFHDDLHGGNVLLQFERGETGGELLPRLYLLDLPGVQLGPPLNWQRSRESLAMVCGASLFQSTARQRALFWKTYVRQRQSAGQQLGAAQAAEVLPAAWQHSRTIARRRDRRCMKTNRDFLRRRSPEFRAVAVRDLPLEVFDAWVRNPDALLAENLQRPVKLSHQTLLVQAELPVAGNPTLVACKRSRARHGWRAMVSLDGHRAWRAWRLGNALLERGIATPRPLAVWLPTSGPRRDSYLITQWLEGALNLHLYARQLAGQPADVRRAAARQTAVAVGALLGRMHAFHIDHGDLKGANLAITGQLDATTCWVVDTEDICLRRKLDLPERAANLGRLAASMSAHGWIGRGLLLRCLRAYLQAAGEPPAAWKEHWRQAARWREFHRRRLLDAGRPIL